jgi:UDP-glucose/GDP-mannose dehydrogenase family, UDP binding domain.
MDGVIVAVAHEEFKQMKLDDLARMTNDKPVLIDVRGMFAEAESRENGFYYRSL